VYKVARSWENVLMFASFYLESCIWSDADHKQQRVNICGELRQIASHNATFLSRVITGEENWICGYDTETNQESSQQKSTNLQIPKKARQVKSNVKSMLIVFSLTSRALFINSSS
jgi:hypothetical protein